MGNQKLRWTEEEEEALTAGVAKHGTGKWKNILADPEFNHKLILRSNVDLKDKWRNLCVTAEQGSGANRTPNGQASTSSVLPPTTENSSSVVTKDNVNDKPSSSSRRAKNGPAYPEMILDALSSIKDRNGSDFSSILEFIENKYEVPQNFNKTLSSELRKLIMQGKAEKVNKHYKIKQASVAIRTPSLQRKVVTAKPRPKPRSCFTAKEVQDAAKTIAKHVAEAENKSFIAAEAITESEQISRLAEDSDEMVMHLKEIFEQWEKKKQNALSTPNVSISRPSLT
ncbi:hypothetical protein ACS0TY_012649 [Phlomoides rotata]